MNCKLEHLRPRPRFLSQEGKKDSGLTWDTKTTCGKPDTYIEVIKNSSGERNIIDIHPDKELPHEAKKNITGAAVHQPRTPGNLMNDVSDIETDEAPQAVAAKSIVATTESSPKTFNSIPVELFLKVAQHLLAYELMSLILAIPNTKVLVSTHLAMLTKAIITREEKRLQDAMKVPNKPNYTDLTLLDALILWCSYWGRPHPTRYRDACNHFARDFNEDNCHLYFGCVSVGFRLYFWSLLAEYLLCINQFSAYGHEHSGPFFFPRDSWVGDRVNVQYKARFNSGRSFLKEVIDIVSRETHHFCLDRLMDREQWTEMVRSMYAIPVVKGGLSIVTLHATQRQELEEAVRVGMGEDFNMDTFELDTVGLPACAPGFRYVPCSRDETDEHNAKGVGSSSVEGVRSTHAAKLVRRLFEVQKDLKSLACSVQLLRAAIMESMHVCDSPFELGHRSPDRRGRSWKSCMERYGKKSSKVRDFRGEAYSEAG